MQLSWALLPRGALVVSGRHGGYSSQGGMIMMMMPRGISRHRPRSISLPEPDSPQQSLQDVVKSFVAKRALGRRCCVAYKVQQGSFEREKKMFEVPSLAWRSSHSAPTFRSFKVGDREAVSPTVAERGARDEAHPPRHGSRKASPAFSLQPSPHQKQAQSRLSFSLVEAQCLLVQVHVPILARERGPLVYVPSRHHLISNSTPLLSSTLIAYYNS